MWSKKGKHQRGVRAVEIDLEIEKKKVFYTDIKEGLNVRKYTRTVKLGAVEAYSFKT